MISRSLRGTRGLARSIGAQLRSRPGCVVAFVGELGSGKTTFVRAMAEGFGVVEPREVVSPTYALMNVHPGDALDLVHIDFYRLDDADHVVSLGLEEQLGRDDAVVAVEWADKLPQLLPANAAWITLEWRGPQARCITVRGIDKPRGVRLSRA